MRPGTAPFAARSRSLKYDVTLKTLLMNGAPALLTQLAGTSAVTLTPAEYPVPSAATSIWSAGSMVTVNSFCMPRCNPATIPELEMSRPVLQMSRRCSPSPTRPRRDWQGRIQRVPLTQGQQGVSEHWQLLVGLQSPEALVASCMAAAVQRSAIEASRQRFTLRQTRRTVPIMFSMMLVQASERRSSFGRSKPDHA